jgi:hypothetical protein
MFLAAENFSRCASRPISMGLWTHFARGSNFLNWTLFGSGYAGLGLRRRMDQSIAALNAITQTRAEA